MLLNSKLITSAQMTWVDCRKSNNYWACSAVLAHAGLMVL